MCKVLLVDDERNIREGIQCFIDWESLNCKIDGAFANGRQVIDYLLDNQADIIITDIKMPVMDGLELSKILSEEYPDIKVIILSAYSDFAMAQKAIRYGVEDFIIKNDFLEELPKVVAKLTEKISKEEKERKTKLPGNQAIIEGLKDCRYCICACEIESMDVDGNYNLNEMLGNILNISLKGCQFDLIPSEGNFMEIVIRYPADSNITLNTIVEYFNNILIMVEEFMRINIRVGLSLEANSQEQFIMATAQAAKALARIFTKESELSVFLGKENGDTESELVDVDHFKAEICDLLFSQDDQESKAVLKAFGDALLKENIDFTQCQLYTLVIYSAMIHKAVKYHLDIEQDFNQMETDVYKKIQATRTLYGLIEVGNETIDNLRSLCIGKMSVKNELVKKVDDCIKQNYKEDLNLNFISNTLYLNSSYVSRAYKKLTGITVTEKINLYRVGKAKTLLKNTNKKIYEIADEVGFKDAAYFTNVFIKYCGMNPSEYRTAN